MKRLKIWKAAAVFLIAVSMMCAGVYAAGTAPMKKADLYLYVDEDTTLAIGRDTDKMERSLGSDYRLERLPSCLYEGEDHVYYYDGVTVFTHPEDDEQIIDEIQVTSQKYPTRRGIWVGSPVSEVIERYGRQYEKQNDTMSYYITKQARIIFTIRDGLVAGYSLYNVPIG